MALTTGFRQAAFLAILLAPVVGCATSGTAVPVVAADARTASRHVAVLASNRPARRFVIVGFVSATSRHAEALVPEVMEQAAALGADAVLGFRASASGSAPWMDASGVAVRWL